MEGTSICVLAMNKPDILKQTIDAIGSYAVQPYEVIIVDNGSNDPRAIEYLDHLSQSDITVIRNETNSGLSIGTNQGLEAGQYDCLIHLDDDCLISTVGWNQTIRGFLLREEIGIVIPGSMGEAIHHDGYDELKWGLGMCWAINKSLFDNIGGYDPQLMHQNECDMALRVRMTGYRVAGVPGLNVFHNDPGGLRSDLSLAREHLGCVQFRDKWAHYFKGQGWTYGTDPVYLMQHWPPDEEFMRRWAAQEGVNINPAPDLIGTDVTEYWSQLDSFSAQQILTISGGAYLLHRTLRTDYMHWEHQHNPGAYHRDRDIAIQKWQELTGDLYTGYQWNINLLRPY